MRHPRTSLAQRILVLLLLASLVAPAGCRQEPAEKASSSAAGPLPPRREAPMPLTPDEKLAEAVCEAMLQAPALATENIKIAVVQKQVFLTGEVSAPHLRDEAVAVAGSVPGVLSVQSKIHVKRK